MPKPSGRRCRTAERMDLSIVIVSYNVKEYLEQALRSVAEAAAGTESEITVVDNGSSDGSPAMVRSCYPGINLITAEVNPGFGAACNLGIEASSGEYILILNPDTIVAPDALRITLQFMREHPDAGAAGARMTDSAGRFLPESKRAFPSPLTSFFRLAGLGHLFPHSALFNRYYLGDLPDNATCEADILTGAFMFIRRSALEKAGLFDTSFFMYGEDIDMSWRIVKAGYKNYFLAEASIVHFKGKSSGKRPAESVRHFYDAMLIFSRKYFSRILYPLIYIAVKTRMHLALLAVKSRH